MQQNHGREMRIAAFEPDILNKGFRAASARDIKPRNIAAITAKQALDLPLIAHDENGHPVRRAGNVQVTAGDIFHRGVKPFEIFAEAANVLLAIIGVNDKIIAGCFEPFGLRWPGECGH